MRKIKSVRLTRDYDDGIVTLNNLQNLQLTTEGKYLLYCYHSGAETYKKEFTEEQIRLNPTKMFYIEYEPEEFEFRSFCYFANDIYNRQQIESELNRLADWCDGQSEKDLPREYFVEYDDISLLTDWAHDQYFRHGLKFNSNDSASLFITELNKPENSNYKNYFIELLKKTRL